LRFFVSKRSIAIVKERSNPCRTLIASATESPRFKRKDGVINGKKGFGKKTAKKGSGLKRLIFPNRPEKDLLREADREEIDRERLQQNIPGDSVLPVINDGFL